MKRSISTTALLLTSVSAIIGSGWLFAAFYTAKIAGPATILSWLIGGAAIMIVAFVFAELSAMLPITGSSSRVPHFTHGSIVSFLFAWLIWLSYAALVPTEVQAIIQYLNFYLPYLNSDNGGLTTTGYWTAGGLMLLISTINVFSLRWLIRANNLLTLLKLIIPIFVAFVLLVASLPQLHVLHPAHSSFMPFGWHGVFAAIASGGIVFAFNGFKLASELAGETRDPRRSLPIAIVGSIVICLAIYLLLQLAFLGSLTHMNLAAGWQQLFLMQANSPFAAIALQHQARWLLPILYVGAISGPLAAALIYAGSAARSLYGTSQNGYLPLCFELLTANGSPIMAITFNFVFGMLLFAPLPGWKNMVRFLTSIMGITYAIAPVCLLALRHQAPEQKRPFRLPYAKAWSMVAFYLCTLFSYWSGWYVISKLFIAIGAGFAFLFLYHRFSTRGRAVVLHWRASIWIWPYFVGLTLLSYLSHFGGTGDIAFGWDFIVIAIFCYLIMRLAMRYKLPSQETQQMIAELQLRT